VLELPTFWLVIWLPAKTNASSLSNNPTKLIQKLFRNPRSKSKLKGVLSENVVTAIAKPVKYHHQERMMECCTNMMG
jgi:uncharacterized membrane-anchored protein YjiN (DUF445 family)